MIRAIFFLAMGFILGWNVAMGRCPNAPRTDPLQVPRFTVPGVQQ
jgi:hypothetical protein